ncbi:DUF1871 family protein [Bacillus carboniphilus]|uniref:DUF1871 family protein n=1 Tax=Bacillus carboniphilus TaxID=86663 RepID=A0ABY9JR12_9BACI|nr:DUF1871 family protein [Bacillus carboniphilus]WLR41249.1 DUF1871 family protein [Bacillus carboniphilus]
MDKIIGLLKSWDPLGYGEAAYETEVMEVISYLYSMNDLKELASRIQEIYFQSFEQMIPIQECINMAGLLQEKVNEQSCER